MSNLLMMESPLVIQPTLAKILGLNEAIVLQQVNYWVEINRNSNKNLHDGKYWTYNSINEWQKTFIFWSIKTVERIFKTLENMGILLVGNYNKDGRDRTKWYTINYDELNELCSNEFSKIESEEELLCSENEKTEDKMTNCNSPKEEMQSDKMTNCNTTDCHNTFSQSVVMMLYN